MLKTKRCIVCNEVKPISDFYKHKGNKDGYRNDCIKCKNNKYIYECEVCSKTFSCGQKGQRFCSLECMGVNNTGEGNSFYGKTHSSSTKQTISKNRTGKTAGENHPLYGKKRSQETVDKWKKSYLGKSKGKNNPNYNPDLTNEERITRRNYHEYRQWRHDVYVRDNYTCQCCGDTKSGIFQAHHLDGYSNHKEKRTDVDNGITLCRKCHKKFHELYGYHDATKIQFDNFLHNKEFI